MTTAERIGYISSMYGVNSVLAARIASDIKSHDDSLIQQYLTDKPKPFVKWVGGKRQLLTQFKEKGLYPPKSFDATKNTYFEPFVGGGAVFFDLLPLQASINDINTELFVTYTVIKNSVEQLISELNSGEYIYEKDVFLNIRALQTETISEIKRAARFIYLNRTAFNGMYRVNSKGQFNVPFGRYTNPQICDEQNLRRVAKVLKNVTINNNSYKYVLDEAKSGDFIYFDPPYYPVSKTASFTAYSSDVFLQKEQVELKETFFELHKRGCFVMLSNSDTPFIHSLFEPLLKQGITVNMVQAGRNINSMSDRRGKVFEVLVTNY